MKRARPCLMLAACSAWVFTLACGGGSSHKTNPIAPSGQNVASIMVDSGPNGNYANGLFVSVTVCVPSSSTCQTVPNVLVDTGSSGLRILSSALTVSLPQQKGANGSVAECLPFISGFTWGPVQTADIQIASEVASSVPLQVISETTFPVPSSCKSNGSSMDTVQTLGANGLLGVGLAAPDCGSLCAETGASNPGLYYNCTSSGCTVSAQAVAQQVQNPVTMFASDNNGVIVELPAVSAPAPSLNGSLVFGIGTQSNNGLNGATVYTVDHFGNISTNYKGQPLNGFIDSGSNGLFFNDSSIPQCTQATGFYCPASTLNLSATNKGTNNASGTVNFSIANAETLFQGNNFVFNDLGGPGSDFDWGLPFFFGRNVFVAIEGKNTSGGLGPYWAY